MSIYASRMNYIKTPNPDFEQVFDAAIESFPHKLHRTGYAHGEIESAYRDEGDPLEFSEEFTFDLVKIGDDYLVAGGWIDIRKDSPDDDLQIAGMFTLALNHDFESNRLLSDHKALLAYYDLEQNTWELSIDSY